MWRPIRIGLRATVLVGVAGTAFAGFVAGRTAAPPAAAAAVGDPVRASVAMSSTARNIPGIPVVSMPRSNRRAVVRDLFAFRAAAEARAAPAPAIVDAVDAPAPVPAAPPVRPLTLVGIAAEHGDASPVRIAIISGEGELFLVKEGETVASAYLVSTVSPDSAELIRLTDRTTISLRLK